MPATPSPTASAPKASSASARASHRRANASASGNAVDARNASRAAGEEGTYWGHASIEAEPQDTNWRAVRLAAPPPTAAERVVDRLAALNAAHHAGVPPPPAHDADADADGPSDEPPLAWSGDHGGDVRLRTLVPLLLEATPYNWALIATHVHGRSGRECQQRWRALMREAATSIPEGEAAAAAADADAVAAHEMESGELEASPGAAPRAESAASSFASARSSWSSAEGPRSRREGGAGGA